MGNPQSPRGTGASRPGVAPPGMGNKPPAQRPAPSSGPKKFTFQSGRIAKASRAVLYGPGKVGKSTLASLAPGCAFIDLEGGTNFMDLNRVGTDQIQNYNDLLECLRSPLFEGPGITVVDNLTNAQALSESHVLNSIRIKDPARKEMEFIEDFGWAKGYRYNRDNMGLLLQELDRHVQRGRNVIAIAHEVVCDAPNPEGEAYLRHEPNLQATKNSNFRNDVIQWADHIVFMNFDVAVSSGKGKGGKTRTVYTLPSATHIAGSREHPEMVYPFTDVQSGVDFWKALFNLEA